ncbi:MAG TPA: SDR family oxidoreductase [bacterium]|nr:SDR family oxidoreductase [bacterium]
MNLKGKVALITGSTSSGMGRSTAFTLAARGADIVLNYGTNRTGPDVDREAERVKQAVEELGAKALLAKADTKSDTEILAMVKAAQERFGHIDILVNNAGGPWIVRDYIEIPTKDWDENIASEITGDFLLMKYLVPGMRERKWGRIIHIGMFHDPYLPGVGYDYCLGKAARTWMTTSFGLPEFDKGITMNCIEPGLTRHMEFEEALRAAQGDYADWLTRDRVDAPDVAEMVAFLCTEAGRFISGSVIRIPTR